MSEKIVFEKPGNFLYPVPAVMISVAGEVPGETDRQYREKSDTASYNAAGIPNIITVAWAGTVCSDPPMLSISVRRSRYSWHLLKEHGEFFVNLTTDRLVRAADFCGVRSGRNLNKFEACNLTAGRGIRVQAPVIEESPVNIECRVKQVLELGTHDMFLAEVVCIQADSRYMDEKGSFHLEKTGLTAYSHGKYYELGRELGSFGYSVRKKTVRKRTKKMRKADQRKADQRNGSKVKR